MVKTVPVPFPKEPDNPHAPQGCVKVLKNLMHPWKFEIRSTKYETNSNDQNKKNRKGRMMMLLF